MEAFLVSLLTVSIAELGDKTQLLAFLLASRFRRPIIVGLAIVVATFFSHLIAAGIGEWIGDQISDTYLHCILGISFILTAVWALLPDKFESEEVGDVTYSSSVFITVVIAFFLAEIGDKTQVATAILGARFNMIMPVVLGTTCGMLLANIPAIFLGQKLIKHVPIRFVRLLSSLIFVTLGGMELFSAYLL